MTNLSAAHHARPIGVTTGCVPPTSDAGLNATRGLPGPTRIAVEADVSWGY